MHTTSFFLGAWQLISCIMYHHRGKFAGFALQLKLKFCLGNYKELLKKTASEKICWLESFNKAGTPGGIIPRLPEEPAPALLLWHGHFLPAV
ncbi:hypothetical protein D770_15980 [Flammeovirgaceae bacterium 311]|nr:hypothetical protein D770_15980 [Flammeovirgaceae bacterium 311]